MGLPAARVGDNHLCPVIDPGPKPHVGGPILPPGCVTVLIGGMPAAGVGDMASCVGPPDTVTSGSTNVIIGNKPAARVTSRTAHGGNVVKGCASVLIGTASAQASALLAAAESGTPFCETNCDK